MKYDLNAGSRPATFETIQGQEIESIEIAGSMVYFPGVKCKRISRVSVSVLRIDLENQVSVHGETLIIRTTAEPETKDIWDLTTEDIGRYLKVSIDGHSYEGKVSDFAEELTYFLDEKTDRVKCEGERNVFVGEQRHYSISKDID